jgi:hypothetical protein
VLNLDKRETNKIKANPQKPKRFFQDETPEASKHDLKRSEEAILFLTPTIQKLR